MHKPLSKFECWIVPLTILGIFVAGFTGAAIYWQAQIGAETLGEVKKGGQDTHVLAEAAKTTAESSKAQAENSAKQIVIAGKQAKAAQDSVKAMQRQMRQDQRAWLKISFTNVPLEDNTPIHLMSELTNTGKTPAKKIRGDIVVTVLKRDQMPEFVYTPGHPRYGISTGILFPDDSIRAPYQAMRRGIDKHETIVFDAPLKQDFAEGKSYIIAHARITYIDMFGTDHWLKFCEIVVGVPNPYETSEAYRLCFAYNDADTN